MEKGGSRSTSPESLQHYALAEVSDLSELKPLRHSQLYTEPETNSPDSSRVCKPEPSTLRRETSNLQPLNP